LLNWIWGIGRCRNALSGNLGVERISEPDQDVDAGNRRGRALNRSVMDEPSRAAENGHQVTVSEVCERSVVGTRN